jgi:hypothetical protein
MTYKKMTLTEYIASQEWPIVHYTHEGSDDATEEALDDMAGLHWIARDGVTNGDLNGFATGDCRWIWDGQGDAREWCGHKITSMTVYSDSIIWLHLSRKQWTPTR